MEQLITAQMLQQISERSKQIIGIAYYKHTKFVKFTIY